MPSLKDRLGRVMAALRWSAPYRVWHRLRAWDPRLLWRRARFRRWNRAAAADEIVVRPGLRLRIDAQSREPFEWFCFRSLEMARELDAFTREMAACRRFLDVGACHGIFSLVFARDRPEALAVAVEPSPVAYAVLAENVRLGGIDNVVTRQLACGPASGMLTMRQIWHHLEALPRDEAATLLIGGAPDVMAVPMQTLDDLCGELRLRPDLLKIDVEGYEQAVLAGARATLGRDRPGLFLELHPRRLQELGGSAAEVVGLLEALGYGFRRLDGAALSGRRVAARESVSRVLCTARR